MTSIPSVDDLSTTQLERLQRHLMLEGFGPEAQQRLLGAHVAVIGAGGLGAPVLSYLAAAGVGKVSIIDDDVVDRSNLHRQVIHSEARVGLAKTASAAGVMRGLNPEMEIIERRERITAENALSLLAGADVVVDGSDNFPTRYVVSDATEILRLPLVHGAILRFSGQVSVFWSGRGPTYRDLHPDPPAAGEVPSCAEAGVIGVLPGVIGTLMATETIKLLSGVGQPLIGRVLTYDALTARFREILLRADPERPPVTSMHDASIAEGERSPGVGRGAAACGVIPRADERGAGADERAGADGQAGVDEPSEEELDAEGLRALLPPTGKEPVVLVDVREPWEHRLGAIPGSINRPLGQVRNGEAQIPGLEDSDAAAAGERQPLVVLYCRSGARSQEALELIRARRPHARLRVLTGGFEGY